MVSAVCSGRLWYPRITPRPLMRISPSSAIFTSVPGSGGPTVPNLKLVGAVDEGGRARLGQAVALEDQTCPRRGRTPPSRARAAPSPRRSSACARRSGSAASRTPAWWRWRTSSPASPPGSCRFWRSAETSRPTSTAHLKMLYLTPPSFFAPVDHLVVDLLEDARHGGHEGRLHVPEVLDDLVHPAVDGGVEADLAAAPPRAPCRSCAPAAARRTARRRAPAASSRRCPRPRRPSSPG